MSKTLTIRLDGDLAEWVEETARRNGISQGRLIREQVEKARAAGEGKGFLRLAGTVAGPKGLSVRKGFSRS